jgi:L-seryl-tRNA(Ser) seleniumtransferase
MTDRRRGLPSVNTLLESPALRPLLGRAPRSVLANAVRDTIDAARTATTPLPASEGEWADAVAITLGRATQASLRRVINATGVVLHTNLGRAPLAQAAIDAIARVASGFSNLEFDVERGERGSRYVHCAAILRELTGAEDAIVVNNCAAALVLALNTVADGRDAIVSRGELIEIGGSFRIPEIMAKSGAHLVEVGTTNRTRVADYAHAIRPETGAIVKVHRSNFTLEGFVAEASVSELAELAGERGIPVLHDLGSGLLLSLEDYGLRGEPTARDSLRDGATLVTMSGDKLLGGPQAGIILGTSARIAELRSNPLARSYRVDKLTLAALEATLALYRDPARARREIPALAQLTASEDEVRERALRVAGRIGPMHVSIVDSISSVGGGAFPTARIPSVALSFSNDVVGLEQRLRAGTPPVVARVADGQLLVDLRTIRPEEENDLVAAIRSAVR